MGGRERSSRTVPAKACSPELYSPRKAAIAWVLSASIGWMLTVGLAWAVAQIF